MPERPGGRSLPHGGAGDEGPGGERSDAGGQGLPEQAARPYGDASPSADAGPAGPTRKIRPYWYGRKSRLPAGT